MSQVKVPRISPAKPGVVMLVRLLALAINLDPLWLRGSSEKMAGYDWQGYKATYPTATTRWFFGGYS